jgi:S1-C subfamily serine protease
MIFSQKLAIVIVGLTLAIQGASEVSASDRPAHLVKSVSSISTFELAQAIKSNQTLTPQQISLRAKQITVGIDGQGTGSGVIVGQSGKTYTVLTNWHVVEKPGQYTVQTPDGRSYAADYNAVKRLPNVDLAMIQFNTDQNYQIAEVGNSDEASEGQDVFYAGYPGSLREESDRFYRFFTVSIVAVLPTPTEKGYSLVYDGEALTGMSGGPVLDRNGFLIGIHGQAFIDPRTGSSSIYAVPINTYKQLAQKAQGATATATAPQQTTTNAAGSSTPSTTKPETPPKQPATTAAGSSIPSTTKPETPPKQPATTAAGSSIPSTTKPETPPKQPATTAAGSSTPSTTKPETPPKQPATTAAGTGSSTTTTSPQAQATTPPSNSANNSQSSTTNNNPSSSVTTQKPSETPANNNAGDSEQVAINNSGNSGSIPTFSKPSGNQALSNPSSTPNWTPAPSNPSTPVQPQEIAPTGQPQEIGSTGQPQGIAPTGQPQGIAPTPNLAPSNTSNNLNVNDGDSFLISSATGMDYRPIRDLLAQEKWQEADLATNQLLDAIVQIARSQTSGEFINVQQVSALACIDLSTLDRIWSQYSNGRFGFRPQQQVWTSLAGTGNYSTDQWRNFATQVGWKKGDVAKSTGYLLYDQLTFNPTKAPPGHLPWWFGYEEDYQNLIKYMFSHCSFDLEVEKQKAAAAAEAEKNKKPQHSKTKPGAENKQPNANPTPNTEEQQQP